MSENFTEEFRVLSEGRFATEMSIAYPNVPIEWPDTTFKQPNTGMWVRMLSMQNPAQRKSIGGGKFVQRTTGFLQFDVVYHTEANNRVPAQTLCDFLCDLFSFREFAGPNIKATFVDKLILVAPTGEFGRFVGRVTFRYDGFSAQRPL